MLKDHLGNVRMVLTEEVKQNTYPAATLESVTFNGSSAISVEDDYYNVTAGNVVPQTMATGIPVYQNNNIVPNNNPYSNTTANSASLYKLDAATNTVPNKTGLGITLKVMAGDNINVFGISYHKKPAGNYVLASNPISVVNILDLFSATGLVSPKGISGTQISTQPGFPTTVTNLLNNQPAQTSTRPRAGINWVVLDEQFKWVSGGFDMVGDAGASTTGTFKNHVVPTISIPKNGYIYIYCSNESQYSVFFDNLQVIHKPGPILEETHYYPFGLAMAGISSKAAINLSNTYKFNGGSELNGSFDVNFYETACRLYDPQIGRFWQVDELAESNWEWSAYMFSLNNPMRFNDPLGLDPELGLNAGTAKVLDNVVVFSIPKSFWAQKRAFYRINDLIERQGVTIDMIQQESLRKMMERQDYDTKFRMRVGAMTREGDKAFLNAVSWFIPGGLITKARYLGYAAKLFKSKRGVAAANVMEQSGIELGKEILANWGNSGSADLNDAFTSVLTSKGKIGVKVIGSVYNSFVDASVGNGVDIPGVVGNKDMNAVGRDLIFDGIKTYAGAAAAGSASERTQLAIDVMIDQSKKIVSNAGEN